MIKFLPAASQVSSLALAALSLISSPSSYAQVTVGYSTLTSVVGSAVRDQAYRQRTTDQFEVSGVNVEPLDGGNVFDRKTIWKIYDQNESWSLSIVESDPRVDVSKQETQTKLVQAGRRESVYSTISGPLYNTIERRTLNPFAAVILPPIIPISTSVFPEDLGSTKQSQRQFNPTN